MDQKTDRSHSGVAEALGAVVVELGGMSRPSQQRMAEAVGASMQDRRHLVVQAGTGTGKSLAYLVPAVLHAVGSDTRVVVSTATLALQRQLMERDVPAVVAGLHGVLPRDARVALLKGRANYVCRLRLAGGEGDPGDLLPGTRTALEGQAASVREWAEETPTGDRDDFPGEVDPRVWRAFSVSGRECVGKARCPFGEECFAEAARDAAARADVVVTNHSLVAIDLHGEAVTLPEFDVAVLDEAHEFADRVVAAQTEMLGVRQVDGLAALARSAAPADVVTGLREASAAFDAALRATVDSMADRQRLTALPAEVTLALTVLRDRCHEALGHLVPKSGEADAALQRARAEIETVHDLAGRLLVMRDEEVVWCTGADGAVPPALHVAPLSVHRQVREGLLGRATVIATSATLTVGGSFDHVVASLGLTDPGSDDGTGQSWDVLDVGSPFRYREQGILYVARDLPRPGRDGIGTATLARIGDLVTAAGGRSLILLSSWRSVDAVAAHLHQMQADGAAVGDILVQQRGVPAGPVVDRFRSEPASSLVGTISLWQGVDVPGDACACVIVEKIPFPRPDDPIIAARQSHIDAAGGSGFMRVSVPGAALLLAQGAGRLIRTEHDRGVVAILDSRFATAGYGSYLRASLPDFWTTSDTAVVLAALRRLALNASPVR